MVNKRSTKRHLPLIVVGVLVVILLAVVVGVVTLGLSWFRGDLARSGVVSAENEDGQPSENVDYAFGQLLPIWVGEERVTVLLLGIDERSQETGPWRTDTMMLVTDRKSTRLNSSHYS